MQMLAGCPVMADSRLLARQNHVVQRSDVDTVWESNPRLPSRTEEAEL